MNFFLLSFFFAFLELQWINALDCHPKKKEKTTEKIGNSINFTLMLWKLIFVSIFSVLRLNSLDGVFFVLLESKYLDRVLFYTHNFWLSVHECYYLLMLCLKLTMIRWFNVSIFKGLKRFSAIYGYCWL